MSLRAKQLNVYPWTSQRHMELFKLRSSADTEGQIGQSALREDLKGAQFEVLKVKVSLLVLWTCSVQWPLGPSRVVTCGPDWTSRKGQAMSTALTSPTPSTVAPGPGAHMFVC